MGKNKIGEKDLEKISGGIYDPDFEPNRELYKAFIEDGKHEEALDCFGAKGTITWGNTLNETIPAPNSKNDTFEYDGKVWKPVFAHCGWHQSEVIWKDPDGNYLVPTGIYMSGM